MPLAKATPRQATTDPFLSLVPLETNQQGQTTTVGEPKPIDSFCVRWRHAHWHRLRTATAEGLQRIGAPPARIHRLSACGQNAWVYVDASNPKRFKMTAEYCHDRFCVPCARRKAREVSSALRQAVPDRPTLFVTLTLRPDGRTLQQLVDLLLKSFSILRRSAVWRSTVTGGASFIEIKRSKGVDGWNVHAHVLCEANWIPHQALKDTWAHITGGSFIVDIRRVRTLSDLANYVSKYVSKGIPTTLASNPEHLDDALRALRGRRLCSTFGSWRGIPLNPRPNDHNTTNSPGTDLTRAPLQIQPPRAASHLEPDTPRATSHSEPEPPRATSHSEATQDATTWIPIGSLDTILIRAASGDLHALAIIKSLEQRVRPTSVSPREIQNRSPRMPKLYLGLVEMALAELGLRRRTTVASLPD